MNSGLIGIAASLVILLASVAIIRAMRPPGAGQPPRHVEGQAPDLKLALLLAVVPAAMGVRFAAAYADDPSAANLILAVAGWALLVWTGVIIVRRWLAGRSGAGFVPPPASERMDDRTRRFLILLGMGGAGLFGVGVASLNSWEGSFTDAWIFSTVGTLVIWAMCMLFVWSRMRGPLDGG
jgi:hypothetical protein